MSLDDFTETVTGMVAKWHGDETNARARLAAIWTEVRNSTAFELATAQRERDEALAKLHRKIVLEGERIKR